MKMLCVKGNLHWAHTGLRTGAAYDVSLRTLCHCGGPRASVLAVGSTLLFTIRLVCKHCSNVIVVPAGELVPWNQKRFIKLDPDQLGVTTEDANRLYETKIKEHS